MARGARTIRPGARFDQLDGYAAGVDAACGMWASAPHPTYPVTLTYQFPSPVTVTQYALKSRIDSPLSVYYSSQMPTAWNLYGSSDGVTWTALDSHSGQSWPGSIAGQIQTYTIATPGSYAYYMLSITANGGSTVVSLNELLLEDSIVPTSPIDGRSVFSCPQIGA